MKNVAHIFINSFGLPTLKLAYGVSVNKRPHFLDFHIIAPKYLKGIKFYYK